MGVIGQWSGICTQSALTDVLCACVVVQRGAERVEFYINGGQRSVLPGPASAFTVTLI